MPANIRGHFDTVLVSVVREFTDFCAINRVIGHAAAAKTETLVGSYAINRPW